MQPLRLGACSLYGLFAFAHDTKDGSKLFCWLVCLVLVGWWLPACLEPRALLVGVLGGYLHALELVPWWLVWLVGWWFVGGYLHTLELVPWWLVCLVVGGYLHALELVPCWLVCPLLIMPLVLGGSYLHALELVPWWLVWFVSLVRVVTCMPWSLCLAGWCAPC